MIEKLSAYARVRPSSNPSERTRALPGFRPAIKKRSYNVFILVYEINGDVEVEGLLRERERQADSDPLTGVLNRRGFEAKVGAYGAAAEPASFALFDLDHFKRINDRFGHPKGDEVSRAIAEVLSTSVRATDIVGRVGGEEFAVLFPQTDEETALDLCDRIRERTAREVQLPCAVTTSVGVARAGRGESVDALAARADAALYRAKNDGRNRVVVDCLKAAA